MKQALFGLALAAITFACASEPKAAVGDSTAPGTECATECSKPCDADAASCDGKAKAECSSEAKICPATGKQIN